MNKQPPLIGRALQMHRVGADSTSIKSALVEILGLDEMSENIQYNDNRDETVNIKDVRYMYTEMGDHIIDNKPFYNELESTEQFIEFMERVDNGLGRDYKAYPRLQVKPYGVDVLFAIKGVEVVPLTTTQNENTLVRVINEFIEHQHMLQFNQEGLNRYTEQTDGTIQFPR